MITEADRTLVAQQLGRPPRAMRAVAFRCPSGHPAVIQTSPRLADGTPFPTLYYLTCPRLTASVSRLEASGLMRELTERLGTEVSAGGMPSRVKCLHVHVAHALAVGAGVNPVGDEVLTKLRAEWPSGACAKFGERLPRRTTPR